MKIIITAYFTAFMLLLSACKVSKDIATPTDAAPPAYRNASVEDTASIAIIEWKNFFTDKDLQQLIDSSIANNYDMQVALKNIEAAQLVLNQSKLGYLPEANL